MRLVCVVVIIIVLLAMVLASNNNNGKEDKELENEDLENEEFNEYNWGIPEGSRFVPVDHYTINDGTVNGIDFVTYVDLANGCTYLFTEKYENGYGTTFTKLTDENGNACIYDDLDALRAKFYYN